MTKLSKAEQAIETKGKILAAATRAIARCGVRGLRLDEVAKEAGVAISLIYYYFKTREDLVHATLQSANDLAVLGMHSNASGETTGREQLISLLTGEFSDRDEVRQMAVVWSEATACAAFDETLVPYVVEATKTWVEIVSGLIRKGVEDGSINPDVDVMASAERLTVLVEGLSAKWLARVYTTERVLQILTSALRLEFGASGDG